MQASDQQFILFRPMPAFKFSGPPGIEAGTRNTALRRGQSNLSGMAQTKASTREPPEVRPAISSIRKKMTPNRTFMLGSRQLALG